MGQAAVLRPSGSWTNRWLVVFMGLWLWSRARGNLPSWLLAARHNHRQQDPVAHADHPEQEAHGYQMSVEGCDLLLNRAWLQRNQQDQEQGSVQHALQQGDDPQAGGNQRERQSPNGTQNAADEEDPQRRG